MTDTLKDFFEKYGLFKKFQLDKKLNKHTINSTRINLDCPKCKTIQTFKFSQPVIPTTISPFNTDKQAIQQETILLEYICQLCETESYWFAIYINHQDTYILKFGQHPSYQVKIESETKKIIGSYLPLYTKGQICEFQGYGIGAFAYYRRIIENCIDELLEKLEALIPTNEKPHYHELLMQAKKSHIATEKIKLIKDLLPENLKPDNINPLDVLYKNLSDGIHSISDEECLEIAISIKTSMIYLFSQIYSQNKLHTEFTANIRELLNKRQKSSSKNKNP